MQALADLSKLDIDGQQDLTKPHITDLTKPDIGQQAHDGRPQGFRKG